MLITQFASGREQFDSSLIQVQAAPTGDLTQAVTRFVAVQGRNAAGTNLMSVAVSVNLAAGDELVVTIPDGFIQPGEYWDSYLISASETGDPGTFYVIGEIPTRDDLGNLLPYPLSQSFSRDVDLELAAIVADPAALPTQPIPGMRRGVLANSAGDALNLYYEFVLANTLIPDDFSVLASANGRWLQVGSFSQEITEITGPGGSDQDIAAINPGVIRPIDYRCDGTDSLGRVYWLTNMSDTPLSSGQRVLVSCRVAGVPRSELFNGLILMRFLGYANTATGELRTTLADGTPMTRVGEEIPFENTKSDFVFQDDLLPGEAYALELKLNLIPEYFGGVIPPGATVEIYPTIARQAGNYSAAGGALGDLIYPEYERCFCVPGPGGSVISLKGSGLVNSRNFTAVPATEILGIPADSTTRILIDGNGNRFAEQAARPKLDSEAIRAIVTKASGVSDPSPWSAPLAVSSNSAIDITVSYPSTIRSGYPDTLIAGRAATPNASQIDVYIRSGGEIRSYTFPVTPGVASESITVPDFNGTVIGSLPAAASADYSLFAPESATAAENGVGTFSGAVEVAYAFRYDGNDVTTITHSPLLGCIPTLSLSIGEMEDSAKSWAPGVASLGDLRQVPQPQVFPYQTRFVVSVNDPYRFDPFSLAEDDGTDSSRSVRPDFIPADQPGRFIQDDSSLWYTGSDAPTNDIGEVGSFYFRNNGEIYEKAAPNNWEYRFRIQGSEWFVDAAAPLDTTGSDNDFAIATNPGSLYRKVSGTWTEVGIWRTNFLILGRNPLASEGKIGDFFINNITFELFQKASAGWESKGSFRGQDGAAGSRIWLVADGAPSPSLGSLGDFAFVQANTFGDFYYKSSATSWSLIGNLQGPQGPQGTSGSGDSGGADVSTEALVLQELFNFPTVPVNGIAIVYDPFDGLRTIDENNNEVKIPLPNTINTWTAAQYTESKTITPFYGGSDWVYEIDPSQGNAFYLQTEGDMSIDIDNSGNGLQSGANFVLVMYVNVPPNNINWGFDFLFPDGIPPSFPNTLFGGEYYTVSCVESDGVLLCAAVGPYTYT